MIENYRKTAVISGIDPAGHYWFSLGVCLPKQEIKLVLVNPCHIKKSREMDDSNLNKNDLKNPKMIVSVDK